jgi:5-methyltetrahydropteroyltriglutamate--homocysteine methyltransferase
VHSLDVDYAELLPELFRLHVGSFYLQLASEPDRKREAAAHIPAERLGTCDDCGFAPFADDVSTSRETAFRKIQSRLEGTLLAAAEI